MKFDINAARSSGYSDEEIADYLATENKFDLSGALKSGYSASEVIGFLSGGEAASSRQELPAGVTPSTAGGGRGSINPPMVYEPQPQQPAKRGLIDQAKDAVIEALPFPVKVAAKALPVLARIPTGKESVLDQPGSVSQTPGFDPMLNQDYVASVRRDILGKVAPEDRMGLLTTLAENRTDVLGRAARQILAEAQEENKRINLDQEGRAQRLLDAPRGPGNLPPPRPGAGASPPVPIPDVTPGFGDLIDRRSAKQIAERRMLAQGVRAADEGMRADMADRAVNLERDRTVGEYLGDLGTRISQGGIMARQVIANSIDPTSDWAAELAQKMKAAETEISAPEQYRARQFASKLAEQPNEWAKGAVMLAEFVTNPTIAVEELARQAPLMGAMIGATVLGGGVGGLLTRGVMAAAPRVALADVISGGMVTNAGRAIGATAAARVGGAVAAGGGAAGQVYEELTSKKNASLMEDNPDVKRLMAEGKTFEDARSEVALTKARLAQSIAATGGAIFGAAGFEGLLAKKIAGQAATGSAKSAAAIELTTELADELTTQGATNFAIGQVDSKRELTQDFGQTAATTLVTSAPLSGASAYLASRKQEPAADPLADAYARARLSTANSSEEFIAPSQTTRTAADVGPSAPARNDAGLVGSTINFTPAGSPTAQAGLAPIVVPVPTNSPATQEQAAGLPPINPQVEQQFGLDKLRMGGADVSTLGATGGEPGLRSPAGGDQPGGGLGIPGRGADVTGQLLGGDAGLPAVNAGANVPTGGATGQPAPGVALPRVAARATDQDLLARTEAAIAAPQNNNADTSLQPWAGRSKSGYATEQDAEQARATASVVLDTKETHDWRAEPMDNGRFQLVPYLKNEQQGLQPAPAAKSDVMQQSTRAGLTLRTVTPGDTVDGRVVREGVPNMGSIASSLDSYEVLPGVREVPMSAFDPKYVGGISMDSLDRRTRKLASEIQASGEIAPLIVVQDAEGMYVLEGGHRFDALIASGAQSLPAVVVIDQANPPGQAGGSVDAGAGVTQPTQAAPTPEPITAPSGKPFSTEKTAAVFAQQNGITDYSTVKMSGGWAIQPTETTLGTQTPQAIQGQTQGQAPAISGAAGQGLAGSLQPGDAAQAGVPAVAGTAAPGVSDNSRQLAPAQSELGQPLAAGASEGERAAVVGGPLFASKAKSAPISAIRLAQDRIFRQSGVEFAPVLPDQLTEQQRAASLIATLNGQTATFIEQTGGDPQKMPNGLAVAGKHVMIDVNSEDAVLSVAMHEVVHIMPDHIRKPLEVALRKLFKPGMEGDFKKEFSYKDADLDREIPAMITQAVTKRKDFWNELRQEMGNKDFSAVAELIITRLDDWVRGVSKVYGDGFVNKYVTDVNEARSLLAKAYAQSMRDQGLQPDVAVVGDGQVMASQRSRVGMNFKDVVKRTPELQAAAERVKAGEMTAAEYDALVNQAKPVETYKSVPAPATVTDIQQALTSDKTERIGKASSLPAGHPVGLRLDIPAYSNHGTWVVSVHEQEAGYNAGKSIGYEPVAAATNVNFGVVEKAALNIASGKPKATIAVMKGSWKPTTAKQAYTAAQAALKSKDWVQVGMDPERHSYFYDRSTMEPVVSADEVLQVGPLVLAKNPVYGDKDDVLFSNKANADATAEGKRVGSVDTHILAAVRGERSMADRTVISAEEKAKIRASAAKLKLPVSDLEAQVREHKAAHPIEDGWAPLLFSGVKKNEDTGKYDLQYKTVPYEFSNGSNGKALQPGTPAYKAQVDRLSGGMLAAVRAVYRRALDGDAAARKIIDQSGWYKEMRTRLRQEFGGLGDLFADLLGATSPNTPVRTNWDNSVEALRLLSQGNFDELMPRWLAWSDRVDEVETGFRAWFNDRLKDGMSKANIKKTSDYKEFAREASQAREMPDDLMPTKANGKKFGFNGGNVVRAFVDLWRVVKNADPDINRGGTAPKAINFSGNLIGFRARATIDVWAARMLQRLAGGLRIPSMAEGGVSGQALEDGRNTLQFGFGQDVFSEAVKLIRNDSELSQDSTLRSINDDDLQALVWFIEKEVWTKGNWTSAAGEGGSFELESDLAGIRDREAVVDLRRAADSSVSSTAEQRQQATADIARLKQEIESLPAIAQANAVLARNAERVVASKTAKPEDKLTSAQKEEIKAENAAARKAIAKARASAAVSSIEKQIGKAQRTLKKPTVEESQATRAAAIGKLKDMSRTVDRFVGGVSIQQGAEQGVEATPPSDAQMAELAKSVEDAVIKVDDGATVIGLKSISTQGLYGSVERALDLEVIARAGFDARPMAAAVFKAADEAQQDAAFVARVLRPDEQFDPLKHRPGIEIYFRDMKQAEAAAKMMAEIAGKRIAKATEFGPGYFEVAGYTIIVDGRRTPTTRSGAMGTPVGMRIIYMPEFEARYGVDKRLVDASENNIRDIVNERADNLDNFASEVMRTFNGVSFAGIFNYEVDTRFAGEYQGAIDAYTGAGTAAAADQGRGQAWQGRPVRESVAAAVGRVSVDGSQQGGELPGGDQVLASNRANRDRGGRQAGRGLAPLEGAPSVTGSHGPDSRIVAVAEQYARDNGIGLKRQAEYVQVDPRRGLRIANAYEVMRHAPNDPKVKEAYSNLIKQTTAQYRALEAAGYKFWFIDTRIPENAEYASTPWNAIRDMRSNQQMGVFPTSDGFGSEESGGAKEGNPMVQSTGIKWPVGGPDGPLQTVLANDLFRAVHDAFGHGMEGAGFREHGEENAWQAHARLFTGSAVGAITSETRGQNSWLNFKATPLRKMVGDAKAAKLHPDNWQTITTGEHNRTAKVEDTIFAEQKTGLMPEWTWTEGRAGDMDVMASNRAAKPDLDKDVVALFKALQDSRGLGRIRAQERVDAHPMAETIRQVDDDFMDILERLDDAGLVKINCK